MRVPWWEEKLQRLDRASCAWAGAHDALVRKPCSPEVGAQVLRQLQRRGKRERRCPLLWRSRNGAAEKRWIVAKRARTGCVRGWGR